MASFIPIVEEALSDEQIIDCHETITEVLRPHRKDISDYLSRVRKQQKVNEYHLMFVKDEERKSVSILGFRVEDFLWSGKTLYIDDFATLSSSRGRGFADVLMKWTIQKGKDLDCDQITLDSGYTRDDGHRFYLNHGFVLGSHHFIQRLK